MKCLIIILIFSIGFSEFFGSRNESELSFSKNKVNGKTFFVMDFDYATHIMVCDKDGQIGIVSLESTGIEVVDLITVDKTRVFKEIIFKNTEVDILEILQVQKKQLIMQLMQVG